MKKIISKLAITFFLSSFVCANPLWDLNEGIKQYNLGEYKNAQNYFADYLNNNPNDVDGYFWLGRTYKKLKKDKLSQEYFKKTYEFFIEKRDIEKNLIKEEIVDYSFEDYFDIAVMYFEAGNYKEASKYADLMLKVNPKSASAYFVKAKVLYSEGYNEEAKENIKKAIIYNNGILSTNLAKSLKVTEIPDIEKEYYYSFAYEKYFQGEIKESIKYTEKYLEENSSDIDMLNFLTELYLKNNDLNSAKETTENILIKSPNNIQNILNKANIASIENDKEEVLKYLEEAYKINPNKEETIFALGNYYLNEEDFKTSKKYFENLISINDELFEGYFGYVYSLIQLKELDKALVLIRKMSQMNENSGDIDYLLAQICILDSKYTEAIDYLYEAIRKNENQNYYFELAKLNYILGRYSQSIVNLQDAIKINKHSKNKNEIDEYFIKNYVKLKDIKSAKNYFNNMITFDKDSLIYKYNIYIIYKLEGNHEQETQCYQQLKKIKPQTQEEYIIISDFLFEDNNYKAAIRLLDSGIKKNPNYTRLLKQKTKLNFLNSQI